MDNQIGLALELEKFGAAVKIEVSRDFHQEFQTILRNFRTCKFVNSTTAQVDLEEFLSNLHVLSSWPNNAPVSWGSELEELVRAMVSDSKIVEKELETDLHGPSAQNLELGENWIADLTDFQKRDVEKIIRLRHGANFSVPGAGKTRASLAVFSHLRSSSAVERVFIVGPKSSYDAWFEETNNCFNEKMRIGIWGEGNEEYLDIALINYERLNGNLNSISNWIRSRPTLMILDEAHRMKLGMEGVYGAACLALGPLARNRLVLSGTPAPNGTRDLENLFSFVWPGFGRQHVANAVGGGDLKAASTLLKPLFARTTKADLELPAINFGVVKVGMKPLHAEIYRALLGHFSARVRRSQEDFTSLGKIMMYMIMAATSPALLRLGSSRYDPLEFRVPPIPIPEDSELADLLRDLPEYEFSAKYEEAVAIVARNVAQGKKTIIWSTFVRNLTTLERMLSKFSPAVVHGSTKNRNEEIDRFKNGSGCMVLLTNPATLGEGISLHHACHDAIYLDRDFSAGRYLQSVDRIHRLGMSADQETNVTVLESSDTIDEVISMRLRDKVQFLGKILDDDDVQLLGDLDEVSEASNTLDSEDLKMILGYFNANPI